MSKTTQGMYKSQSVASLKAGPNGASPDKDNFFSNRNGSTLPGGQGGRSVRI